MDEQEATFTQLRDNLADLLLFVKGGGTVTVKDGRNDRVIVQLTRGPEPRSDSSEIQLEATRVAALYNGPDPDEIALSRPQAQTEIDRLVSENIDLDSLRRRKSL